ncbi:unnamed protein product [Bemisia tabaci]|uniref:Uncharacterized protein n=1 Tax=Bemisia tabaci TaxID=7038 RepID=A0A9P0A2F8_BEMTA|nr:unnamed protein product [Bemisia tabaci]
MTSSPLIEMFLMTMCTNYPVLNVTTTEPPPWQWVPERKTPKDVKFFCKLKQVPQLRKELLRGKKLRVITIQADMVAAFVPNLPDLENVLEWGAELCQYEYVILTRRPSMVFHIGCSYLHWSSDMGDNEDQSLDVRPFSSVLIGRLRLVRLRSSHEARLNPVSNSRFDAGVVRRVVDFHHDPDSLLHSQLNCLFDSLEVHSVNPHR